MLLDERRLTLFLGCPHVLPIVLTGDRGPGIGDQDGVVDCGIANGSHSHATPGPRFPIPDPQQPIHASGQDADCLSMAGGMGFAEMLEEKLGRTQPSRPVRKVQQDWPAAPQNRFLFSKPQFQFWTTAYGSIANAGGQRRSCPPAPAAAARPSRRLSARQQTSL